LLAERAFKGPPYPRSVDLIAALKKEVPAAQHALLADLFERITLFENRALSARARPLPAGQGWELELQVSTKKLRADDLGNETEVAYDEPIEVGVMGQDGAEDKPLLLERRPLGAGTHTVKLRVTGVPKMAGVDPMNKLIDRKPGDNLVPVDRAP
jgi:ABC-2 type transport system permease protein